MAMSLKLIHVNWFLETSSCLKQVMLGFEDLVHTGHLFTTALHVKGTHLLGDSLALVGCDGSESLSFEEVDTGAFVTQVGLEAKEDNGSGRAEMEDFGIPLGLC